MAASGAAPRRCARRSSARSAARRKLRGETVLAAIGAGPAATAARARPTCCARCPAVVEARSRAGAPRRSDRCARRWRPSAASRCAARAVMALGDAGPARAIRRRWREVRERATSRCCATWRRASWRRWCRRAGVDSRPRCARRWPTAIRACARRRRWRWASRATPGRRQALIAGAKQEPWPFVRRAELEALGHLCAPGAGDLMIRAIERDVDEVRRAALVGLVRCKDPRARDRAAARRSASRTRRRPLRELAAALIGELGRQERGAAAGDRAARGWSTRPRRTWPSRGSRRRRCARSRTWAARRRSARR